jgi:hypothetical protein
VSASCYEHQCLAGATIVQLTSRGGCVQRDLTVEPAAVLSKLLRFPLRQSGHKARRVRTGERTIAELSAHTHSAHHASLAVDEHHRARSRIFAWRRAANLPRG